MNDNTVCCQNASVTEPQRDRRPLRGLVGGAIVCGSRVLLIRHARGVKIVFLNDFRACHLPRWGRHCWGQIRAWCGRDVEGAVPYGDWVVARTVEDSRGQSRTVEDSRGRLSLRRLAGGADIRGRLSLRSSFWRAIRRWCASTIIPSHDPSRPPRV